ncbi:MAG: UDP-N-acetylmuramate--L-alanine ligase, partial [Sphaerospermopsis sp. SIO1G2]|nr:UDP-N-acetylmuramate--L-alanine ligase [Sphaerospermopsis sp. SIO1G2]
MRQMPLDIGTFHFVGVGGIGMSGIAEILHNLGYSVQGSDMSASANVQRLRDKGITVFEGHDASNIKNADVLVISTAIKDDNPEVHTARKLALPIVRRAEMLGELMRLKWSIAVGGTHGKTTTTSLVASLLDAAQKDPTVINGGIINAYGTNARLGEGDWLVAEADESDGSFLRLPATISIVTNIDPEHLDHYGNVEKLHQAFLDFLHNIPFYGMAVVCVDDPTVQSMMPKLGDRRVVTYGTSAQADVRAENIRHEDLGMRFDVRIRQRDANPALYPDIYLPMFGQHNVLNSLSALAIAHELGIERETIYNGFMSFGGVKRRFTHTGDAGPFTVIDDYGHHPVEISAVLKAARMAAG